MFRVEILCARRQIFPPVPRTFVSDLAQGHRMDLRARRHRWFSLSVAKDVRSNHLPICLVTTNRAATNARIILDKIVKETKNIRNYCGK